jgi:hypothetical protein
MKPPGGVPAARRDLKGNFVLPAIDRPFGEMPRARSIGLEEKKRPRGQRVLDGLSGARARGRAQAASGATKSKATKSRALKFRTSNKTSNRDLFEMSSRSTAAMIP